MKTIIVRCQHCSRFYRVMKVKSLFWQTKILDYAKCPICENYNNYVPKGPVCKLCGVPTTYRVIHSKGLDHACQMKIIRMSQKKTIFIQFNYE